MAACVSYSYSYVKRRINTSLSKLARTCGVTRVGPPVVPVTYSTLVTIGLRTCGVKHEQAHYSLFGMGWMQQEKGTSTTSCSQSRHPYVWHPHCKPCFWADKGHLCSAAVVYNLMLQPDDQIRCTR